MTESHAPQVSIPVPTQSQSNQEHIEKIFPKLAIKACSFLQLFCAAFAVIIQVYKYIHFRFKIDFLIICFLQIGICYNGRDSLGSFVLIFAVFFGSAGGIGLLAVHRSSYCT